MVTDAPPSAFPGAIFSLDDARWLEALADWTETHFLTH